jgi:hypothetical protein
MTAKLTALSFALVSRPVEHGPLDRGRLRAEIDRHGAPIGFAAAH